MAKLVWRVKLVTERHPGVATETELTCIKRNEQAGSADLGLSLAEAKQLTAVLQTEIVPAQMTALSAYPQACAGCGRRLAARGHDGATFRFRSATCLRGSGAGSSARARARARR